MAPTQSPPGSSQKTTLASLWANAPKSGKKSSKPASVEKQEQTCAQREEKKGDELPLSLVTAETPASTSVSSSEAARKSKVEKPEFDIGTAVTKVRLL